MDTHKVHRLIGGVPTSFADHVRHYIGSSAIPLPEQSNIVNSLANDAAPSGRAGVSRRMYFSTGEARRRPGGDTITMHPPKSVRNLTLYYWRQEGRQADVLSSVSKDMPPPPPSMEDKRGPMVQQEGESAVRTKRSKRSMIALAAAAGNDGRDVAAISLESGDIVSTAVVAVAAAAAFAATAAATTAITGTPFMQFQFQMVGTAGVLKWRIHGSDVDVISMNNINLDSGTFEKNKFVHVSRHTSTLAPEVTYFCSCRMYVAMQHMMHESEYDEGKSCCHVRFLVEQVEPLYSLMFRPSPGSAGSLLPCTPIGLKLRQAMDEMHVPVVRLDSDSRYHRFSVLSTDVRSCSVVRLQAGRFSCKDGKCRSSMGHTREAPKLNDPNNCEHLQAIAKNTEEWEGLGEVVCETNEDEKNKEPPAVPENKQVSHCLSLSIFLLAWGQCVQAQHNKQLTIWIYFAAEL